MASTGNKNNTPRIAVAGHICLDIIPAIPATAGGIESILVPGKLVDVGSITLSTGGSVANTGLALHRLEIAVRLLGKVGDDYLGKIILDILRESLPSLAEGMIIESGGASSYSVVINPPDTDRIFLHCPGANDTFTAADIDESIVSKDSLFHFGYPPLMRSMFEDGGDELVSLLSKIKKAGPTTSLDMALPDSSSPAGLAPWKEILSKTLPHVDLFLPSLDEILYMTDGPKTDNHYDRELLSGLAQRLLDMGAAVVCIKLGAEGLYLRTTSNIERLKNMGAATPEDIEGWCGREIYAPCYKVEVAGCTGAGDCTIAGFLAAFVKGMSPEATMQNAVAVGACNVEQVDAVSGIPSWDDLQRRIKKPWPRLPIAQPFTDWLWQNEFGVAIGPGDSRKE